MQINCYKKEGISRNNSFSALCCCRRRPSYSIKLILFKPLLRDLISICNSFSSFPQQLRAVWTEFSMHDGGTVFPSNCISILQPIITPQPGISLSCKASTNHRCGLLKTAVSSFPLPRWSCLALDSSVHLLLSVYSSICIIIQKI